FEEAAEFVQPAGADGIAAAVEQVFHADVFDGRPGGFGTAPPGGGASNLGAVGLKPRAMAKPESGRVFMIARRWFASHIKVAPGGRDDEVAQKQTRLEQLGQSSVYISAHDIL